MKIKRFGNKMKYMIEELTEAKRQIDSTLNKLRKVIITLEGKENSKRYQAQITLVKRRVTAFEIANDLIEEAMNQEYNSQIVLLKTKRN